MTDAHIIAYISQIVNEVNKHNPVDDDSTVKALQEIINKRYGIGDMSIPEDKILSMDKVKRNIIEQIQDTLATVDSSNLKSYLGSYIDPANDRTVEYEVYFDRKFKMTIDNTKSNIYEVPVKIKTSDGMQRDVFIETFENEAFLEERSRWFEKLLEDRVLKAKEKSS